MAPAPFTGLRTRGGEDHGSAARPACARIGAARAARRSLVFFGQLTDPQIADEMSPARVDFVDPAGGASSSSWRPQEAFGLQVFDQTVRNMNDNRTSEQRAGGKRAKLGFAITTGDLADNQQLNETRWFKAVLDGGQVDPFCGKPISATNPCPGASRGDRRGAQRRGRQPALHRRRRLRRLPRASPPDRYGGFWDPDVGAPGPYAAFPRYPGLMERAQNAFTAEGLKVPWYIARGNHDGLIQGNAPASTDLFRAIATGCLKVFPSAGAGPGAVRGRRRERGLPPDRRPVLHRHAAGRRAHRPAGPGPPDPLHRPSTSARSGARNGYRHVAAAENRASDGVADLLLVPPAPRPRVRSRSTPSPRAAGSTGNLDDPQYRWLEKTLKARAEGGPARDRLRPPHARDDEQHAHRRAGGRVHPAQAGLRRRPAQVHAAPPRHRRRQERPRPVPEVPERDRLRGRAHAREPHRPVPQGQRRASGRSTPPRTSTGRSRAG